MHASPQFRRLCLGALAALLSAAGASAETAPAPEDLRLKAFIEEGTASDLARDPTQRTLSKKTGDAADWTPVTDRFREETARLLRRRLKALPKEIDRAQLSASGQIQYDIYANALAGRALEDETRNRAYFINGNILNFNILEEPARVLQTAHRISGEGDARNYVARLDALPALLETAAAIAEKRQARGFTMIASVFPQVESAARSLSEGAPCGGEGEHALWTDFTGKLAAAEDISGETRAALQADAKAAIAGKVCPAYAAFADAVAAMAPQGREEGLWTTPGGKDAYADLVELNLAERTDPEEIHRLGLSEVERLTGEIEALEKELGLSGGPEAVQAFLNTSDETSLPNTDDGKAAYLAKAQAYIDAMTARLSDYFAVAPKRPLIIRMGEIGSQYTTEEIDGVNTGIYNLSTPRGERIGLDGLASLSYHEGVPGHHLQLSLAEELRDGPDLFARPFSAAFSEGWALYAERLAEEMGVYADDPYGRLGYLYSMRERAARLVLDTGLNYMEWTVADAEAYQQKVFGEAGGLRRYLNWPGQALGYYWGYLEWVRLREAAQEELGDGFDIRNFHIAALRHGSAPFEIIERVVDQWAEEAAAR